MKIASIRLFNTPWKRLEYFKDFEISTFQPIHLPYICTLLPFFLQSVISFIMSTKKPSFFSILSETTRIIIAHPRHFLALSILFILPNAVDAIVYSFLSQPPSPSRKPQLLIQILFLLSTFLFTVCTVTSITYSTFHAYHGKPVNLLSSLKSIPVSFFPLFATKLIVQTIFSLIIFVFVFLVMLSYNGLALLGLEMDYNDPYLIVFAIVIASFLIGLLVYLQVEWCLVNAVVVLESKWGFAPLKRSSYLVKGMRGIVFLVMIPSYLRPIAVQYM